jgi:hypothetical protein
MTSLLRFGHIFMIFGEPGTLLGNPSRHSIAVHDTLIKLLRHECRGGNPLLPFPGHIKI